jgi:UDP-N-acetylglucosamine pyrophosphorylase
MTKATRNISPIKNDIDGKELTVIIPAAGEGTRMKSYGPKSLIKIGKNLTILEN